MGWGVGGWGVVKPVGTKFQLLPPQKDQRLPFIIHSLNISEVSRIVAAFGKSKKANDAFFELLSGDDTRKIAQKIIVQAYGPGGKEWKNSRRDHTKGMNAVSIQFS